MMKTILTKFMSVGCVALLILSSCKKNDALVTTNGGTPGALTASATTLVLSPANLTSSAAVETFTFTKPTFGYAAAVTNSLQIDLAGDNWANPVNVAINTNVLSQTYNTSDLNTLLLKIGIKGGVAGQVNVRVQSALSATSFVYSNVVALTLTPFNLKSWLYVVGAFQGWSTANADSLYSATSNGIYSGIINFATSDKGYLILPQKTGYANKIATNDNGATNTTVAVNASNNLYAPSTAGNYLVILNLNANTISYSLSDYYSVIGDAALGWNSTGNDTPMKYINDGNGNWTVTLPLVSTGSFKIRQDNAWSNSWGVPKAGSAGAGIANTLNSTSNDNISITPSGSYKVTFNAPATAISDKVPALATTTYSAVKQ